MRSTLYERSRECVDVAGFAGPGGGPCVAPPEAPLPFLIALQLFNNDNSVPIGFEDEAPFETFSPNYVANTSDTSPDDDIMLTVEMRPDTEAFIITSASAEDGTPCQVLENDEALTNRTLSSPLARSLFLNSQVNILVRLESDNNNCSKYTITLVPPSSLSLEISAAAAKAVATTAVVVTAAAVATSVAVSTAAGSGAGSAANSLPLVACVQQTH